MPRTKRKRSTELETDNKSTKRGKSDQEENAAKTVFTPGKWSQFSDLPTELLVIIFKLAVLNVAPLERARTLRNLMKVDRRLREITTEFLYEELVLDSKRLRSQNAVFREAARTFITRHTKSVFMRLHRGDTYGNFHSVLNICQVDNLTRLVVKGRSQCSTLIVSINHLVRQSNALQDIEFPVAEHADPLTVLQYCGKMTFDIQNGTQQRRISGTFSKGTPFECLKGLWDAIGRPSKITEMFFTCLDNENRPVRDCITNLFSQLRSVDGTGPSRIDTLSTERFCFYPLGVNDIHSLPLATVRYLSLKNTSCTSELMWPIAFDTENRSIEGVEFKDIGPKEKARQALETIVKRQAALKYLAIDVHFLVTPMPLTILPENCTDLEKLELFQGNFCPTLSDFDAIFWKCAKLTFLGVRLDVLSDVFAEGHMSQESYDFFQEFVVRISSSNVVTLKIMFEPREIAWKSGHELQMSNNSRMDNVASFIVQEFEKLDPHHFSIRSIVLHRKRASQYNAAEIKRGLPKARNYDIICGKAMFVGLVRRSGIWKPLWPALAVMIVCVSKLDFPYHKI